MRQLITWEEYQAERELERRHEERAGEHLAKIKDHEAYKKLVDVLTTTEAIAFRPFVGGVAGAGLGAFAGSVFQRLFAKSTLPTAPRSWPTARALEQVDPHCWLRFYKLTIVEEIESKEDDFAISIQAQTGLLERLWRHLLCNHPRDDDFASMILKKTRRQEQQKMLERLFSEGPDNATLGVLELFLWSLRSALESRDPVALHWLERRFASKWRPGATADIGELFADKSGGISAFLGWFRGARNEIAHGKDTTRWNEARYVDWCKRHFAARSVAKWMTRKKPTPHDKAEYGVTARIVEARGKALAMRSSA